MRGPLRTESAEYADRLRAAESAWWRRFVDVQAPYRWNLRRLSLGFVLDVGCGLGRNLANLGGSGVGVDHNARSVDVARSRGLTAFVPEEFAASEYARPGRFDTILLSHVAEHMTEPEATALLKEHLPLLAPAGRVVVITPQERGFASDPTHVAFMDFAAIRRVAQGADLVVEREYSFPFPRAAGRVFTHNEFVSISARAR